MSRPRVSRAKDMHEMKSDSGFPGQSRSPWFVPMSSTCVYQSSLNQLQRPNIHPNSFRPFQNMHEMKSDSDFSEKCYPGQSMSPWFVPLSSTRMHQSSFNQLQRTNVDPNTFRPFQNLPVRAAAKRNHLPLCRDIGDDDVFLPAPLELHRVSSSPYHRQISQIRRQISHL